MSFKPTSSLALQAIKASTLRRGVLNTTPLARGISVVPLSAADAHNQLQDKRLARPNSPWHIYKPQLTSVTSLANRATGAFLSVAFYATFLGHLALPAVGVPFGSAELVQLFADLPSWAQLSVKTIFAGPMAYHTINGLRHLAWDRLHLLSLKPAYTAGYAVLGATALTTVGLVML